MHNLYRDYIKRLLGFTIALVAIICLSPLLLVVTVWLHFANKGAGAFFFQERPGKDAKVFKIVKFKTMTDERDADGKLLPDDKRLTRVGRFVRATSIDELPQLINVLKGDMALIGPRPLLIKYLPLYSPEQARRHEVRPGITGWAQVNGFRGETRDVEMMEKRIRADIWYIENWNFWLDIRIIWRTLVNTLFHHDENAY